VDFRLGSLFAAVIGIVVPDTVLRAYGAIAGSDQRRKMLIEAAEAFFADLRRKAEATAAEQSPEAVAEVENEFKRIIEVENEFKRLIEKVCQEAAARRNDIAHGLVIHDDRGFFLQPSYRSSRYRDLDLKPTYSYTSKEIEEFGRKFSQLGSEIFELVGSVYDLRGLKTPKD
jgi:hypothetical protein